ncbi:Metallo-dependent hydrolase [Rhizodiscina lignyota]|uniref:adenosine deaminase n=1 Tax=Rhizodiscina lignyota TaxID=1504668 RepID=A0A9P4MGD3_9PEZI|nr:Metallo-dependent hydrolase [Rhizodiscina lignyota]
MSNSVDLRIKYDKDRTGLIDREKENCWYREAKDSASDAEIKANAILLKIREHEREHLFGDKASEAIPGPETRDMGGQFLTNKERIKASKVYEMAQLMPKGAHLHIHFNSEFHPAVLLAEAKNKVPDTLFIRSTRPLTSRESLDDLNSEMVFNVLPKDTPAADIFSDKYNPDAKDKTNNPWIKWSAFSEALKTKYDVDADDWIMTKMVLGEEDVYGIRQTTNKIWARFNQGTRCFKGLMNYESIYRWYIGALIDDMISENVMFAELRPMLMDKSIPNDDGTAQVSNHKQMEIILEEVEKKKESLKKEGRLDDFPFGLKIIYCTPRSIPKQKMKSELQDCIKLKLDFPDLICGFDLVGAEDRPNHIGYYKDELLAFQAACQSLKIKIPFLFHAGETLLDRGGSRNPENSNLYDSVALGAKRIGHGFSLVKHPELAEEFRKRKICIELCPTSNELLHLCRNIKEHPYPELLALGIPCTVNSDNPSLFSSGLNLEFYQVMVGSTTMNLHGWKQLALWSLEHSCLSEENDKDGKNDKQRAKEIWGDKWERFVDGINKTHGAYADSLDLDRT